MALALFLLLFTLLCIVLHDARAWDNVTRDTRNDLVFEGRNRAYGAYVLRREHDLHIVQAFLLALGVVGGLIASAYALGGTATAPPANNPSPTQDHRMWILPPTIDGTDNKPEERRSGKPTTSKPGSGFVEPVDATVAPLDTTTSTGSSALPGGDPGPGGDGDQDGGDDGPDTPGGGDGGGTLERDTLEAWTVDRSPMFPGGETAMIKWVQQHVRFPHVDTRGKHTVHVRFVVDSEGRVAEVQAVRASDQAFAKEAERLVRNMPVWRPAQARGRNVSCRLVLPIRFETRE